MSASPAEPVSPVTMPYAALIACLALLLAGCVALDKEYGSRLPLDEFQELSPGAGLQQVLSQFGPPARVAALSDGSALLYEYVRLNELQIGLALPGDISRWFKAVYGSADASVEEVLLVFDGEGLLRAADAQVWSADAGGGFAATLVYSFGSVTDTANYEESVGRSLHWGGGLTAPVLQGLNRPHSLTYGDNGIELTGTSPAVGQRTLELGAR